MFILDKDALDNLSQVGKITFGDKKYNKRKVDVRIMQDEAIFQFRNSRYKIINDTQKREYTTLDQNLEQMENVSLVLIKLAMLAGKRF